VACNCTSCSQRCRITSEAILTPKFTTDQWPSNTASFKYRCPGCSARTCSLPCYKRHQQWAQCNGKRDPAKFVKKSQLATPAGIDHDYNFLTSIERGLEKARRAAKGRQASDQHFAVAGVAVIRAPKGLSRQKDNKTHQNKKQK
jgi:hypothetical protein